MALGTAPQISVRQALPDGDEVPRSEIELSGVATGVIVSGAVLEAGVACDRGFLVFLTDDVPYEETLSIHLLDRAGQLVDSATLGRAYATGVFTGLALQQPDVVNFRFTGGHAWSVQVLSRPQLRLPFVAEAPGVSRRSGFRRHFVVRAVAAASGR